MSPYVSHPLIAAGLAAVFIVVVDTALKALGITQVPVAVFAAVLGAVAVSSTYYGREAGQREHDLKNAGTKQPWAALGSLFMFLWSGSNVLQWLVAAAGSAAVAVALLLYVGV